MSVGSKVNPNFPIPGLDQSSKGFRDNFAIIKRELEGLQGTTIQLTGGVVSSPYEIGNSGSIVINTAINGEIIAIAPPNYGIQFNEDGLLKGDLRFTFDPVTATLTVGPIHASNEILVEQTTPLGSSRLSLNTPNVSTVFNSVGTRTDIGSTTATPLNIVTNSQSRITVTSQGNVGIGTTLPLEVLRVVGNTPLVSVFETNLANSDNMIKAIAKATNSTIGWGLEHKQGDKVAGIRLDYNGTLTIHTGESAGTDLNTSSAHVFVDKNGKVGIGSSKPAYNLDVNGTFSTTSILDLGTINTLTITASNLVGINNPTPTYQLDVAGAVAVKDAIVFSYDGGWVVDTTPIVIDAWSTTDIRSARYTIQVTRGASPSEFIDIIDYVVMHVNGTAVATTFNSFSSGGSLGALSVAMNGVNVEVSYTGYVVGNVVRLSKVYIIN